MKKTLDKKWQDKLAGLPEDGMGYQRVTVIFADGGVREDVLVMNGQECELPDGDAGREIKDVRVSGGADKYCHITLEDGKKLYLQIEEESPKMIVGYEVNKDGEEVIPRGYERRKRYVERAAIKKYEPKVMSLMYETLVDPGHERDGLEANWVEEEPPVTNEAERRRRIRKKIDDAILALPKPVHVETLMSSGKGSVPAKVLARLNNLIGSLGITGYTMRQIMDDVDDGSESRSRRCGSSLSKFDKKNGVAEFSSVCQAGAHKQRVTFEDWETILELATEEGIDVGKLDGTALFRDQTVGDLLKESDVKIYCSCPAYKFYYAFIAYSIGFGELGEANDSPPNIRNPNYEGVCCKHLVSVYDHYFK